MCLLIILSISYVSVCSSGCAKNLSVEFSEKTRLFGEIFCFQIRTSLLNALVVNFWNHVALRRHLLNSGCFPVRTQPLSNSIMNSWIVEVILKKGPPWRFGPYRWRGFGLFSESKDFQTFFQTWHNCNRTLLPHLLATSLQLALKLQITHVAYSDFPRLVSSVLFGLPDLFLLFWNW